MNELRYQVIDMTDGSSRGVFDTLDEAQSEVSLVGLVEYDIWLGDELVESSDPDA